MIVQMTGLSGAGKTTLAMAARDRLQEQGHAVAVIDGDVYRKTLCRDLGFSRADRIENIRRLSALGLEMGGIVLIAAINPYEEARAMVRRLPGVVKTVWVDCALEVLRQRDTKGLYRRASLPEGHPDRVNNLTGVNDPFELPLEYDLRLDTTERGVAACTDQLMSMILSNSFPL